MAGIFDKDNKEVSSFLKGVSKSIKKDDGTANGRFAKIMDRLGRKDPGEPKKRKEQKKIERSAQRKGSLGDVIGQFAKDSSK